MSEKTELPVHEWFVSFQGEGPYAGRRCAFIRLGHCNLHCPPCDSKPTWDTSQYNLAETCPPAEISVIRRAIGSRKVSLIVVTGGEPLMWQAKPAFERFFSTPKMTTHLETNGTIIPLLKVMEGISHFTVSPKLSAMGGADPTRRRIKPQAIAVFRELAEQGKACFKFVVSSEKDIEEVRLFVLNHDLDKESIWIMPEGTTAEVLLERQRELAPIALRRGYNFSTRLHILNRQR